MKLTRAMNAAMRLTAELEFQRLRQAVRRLDVFMGDLKIQKAQGRNVTPRLVRTCELRAQAAGKVAELAGLMNRKATN